MPRCGSHGWLTLAGLALAFAGCSAPPPPKFENWGAMEQAYAPSPNSGNAFDGYVIAARDAEVAAGDLASYVSFEGRHKRMLIERLGPAVTKLRRAAALPCNFKFIAKPPFEPDPHHSGWRLLRYSLNWQLEAALTKGDFDTAVNLTILSTKVGFDLAGGGARDADSGLQFVDDSRRAMASHLQDLSPAQLSRLTNGLKTALGSMPAFEKIAQNESRAYLEAIQWIQDQYQSGTFDKIDANLGSAVRDAVTYLKQVRKDDHNKRPAYFQGFADEAAQVVDWHKSQSVLPVVKRKADKEMPLAEERPWRRFSGVLFSTLKPILARYDATLARTRLLILTGEIHRQIKAARVAPASLGAFSPDLTIDPYSGQTFKYRASGMEFYLYSVGMNFQDDQANTDSTFSHPDLTLETSRR